MTVTATPTKTADMTIPAPGSKLPCAPPMPVVTLPAPGRPLPFVPPRMFVAVPAPGRPAPCAPPAPTIT